MNPETPDQNPRPTYALPIIAIILSVVGVCFCPLALVGMILGIVAWVRISKEPQLPGKGLAIAATFVPVALIPVMGIMAAIAIPNFIKYQARAKQSECRVQLKMLWVAQRSMFAEKDAYGTTFEELGVSLLPSSRYSYFLSDTETLPTATEDYQGALRAAGVQVGADAKAFTAACVGNLDTDLVLDVWSVSSESRTSASGEAIPAGTVHNDVNDVTESR